DIVEIVCDASGERADAFHALRAKELLLELLSLREVEDERDAFLRIVGERGGADENGHARSVAANVLFLVWRAHTVPRDLALRFSISICEIGSRDRGPRNHAGVQITARVSDNAQERIIGRSHHAGCIPEHDALYIRLH